MTIPPEAIEAASVELAFMCKQKPSRFYRYEARAVIEAAMPAIREALAQEIETDLSNPTTYYGLIDAAAIVRGGT